MSTTSTALIGQWTETLKRDTKTGCDRLRAYLASRTLGREFGETGESYLHRTGLTEFYEWARTRLPKEQSK